MTDTEHEVWLQLPQTVELMKRLNAIKDSAAHELTHNEELHYSDKRFAVFAEYNVAAKLVALFEEGAQSTPETSDPESDDIGWGSVIDGLDAD